MFLARSRQFLLRATKKSYFCNLGKRDFANEKAKNFLHSYGVRYMLYYLARVTILDIHCDVHKLTCLNFPYEGTLIVVHNSPGCICDGSDTFPACKYKDPPGASIMYHEAAKKSAVRIPGRRAAHGYQCAGPGSDLPAGAGSNVGLPYHHRNWICQVA